MRRVPPQSQRKQTKKTKKTKYPPNYSPAETPNSQALWAFLCDYLATHPFAPSLNEMMAGVGLSRSTTYYTLGKLMAQERVVRAQPRSPRALLLLEGKQEQKSA